MGNTTSIENIPQELSTGFAMTLGDMQAANSRLTGSYLVSAVSLALGLIILSQML